MNAPPTPAANPPSGDKPRERHPWRDNLETIAVAIVLALALKVFVVEAYKIPTGSMQPTLFGSVDAGIYDRILVDKAVYLTRDPRRFEVVVFRFPLDVSKNYIKRIVGVGPEEFRVARGDLWRRGSEGEAWQILRKPRTVQEEVWKEVWSGPSAEASAFRDREWLREGPWRQEGDALVAEARGGPARLQFGDIVRDGYTDGYPARLKTVIRATPRAVAGPNDVRDLRLSFAVRPSPECNGIRLRLEAGTQAFEALVPGPASEGPTRLLRDGAVVAEEKLRPLRAERETRFAFAHVDGALELERDGEVAFRFEYEDDPDENSGRKNRVLLEIEGGGARIRRLRLERDIHHTTPSDYVHTQWIPAGKYFMMGDNTQDSADSRAWQSVTWRLSRALEGVVELRGNHRPGNDPDGSNPRPHPRDPNLWIFTDGYGEAYLVPRERVGWSSPMGEHEPLVDRRLILGKALVVFWPFPPVAPVFRPKIVR